MQTLKEALEELPSRITIVRLIRITGELIERCSVTEAMQKYGDMLYSSGYSESHNEVSLWAMNNTK